MHNTVVFTRLFHIVFLFEIAKSAVERDPLCDVENPISNVRRSLMLYDHNLYRSRIAQQIAVHNGGTKLPQGSNIYKVKWSCHLEKLASEAVKYCPAEKPDSSYAQNYQFIETADEYDLSNPYSLALERWIAPMLDKNFSNDAVTFTGDGDVQAFANMIRANTTLTGCSQRTCKTFAAISCFYDSPNLMEGELIYKTGEACKQDTDCTTYLNSTCDAENGLCVRLTAQESNTESFADPSVPRNESMNSTSYLTTTSDDAIEPTFIFQRNGTNKMCPQSPAMTDKLRMIVLSHHNQHRSALAKGQVKKVGGAYLPTAANMVELRYSCVLETLASTHAAKCAFNDSDVSTRMETGENTAMITFEDAVTFEKATELAISSWWLPITRDYGLMGKKVIFREVYVKQPVRHMVQMGWADTHEVGCAMARCDNAYNLVCRYFPRGNHIMHPLYEVGEPCSNCPMDMRCEQDAGLCVQQKTDSAQIYNSLFTFLLTSLVTFVTV